MAQAPDRPEGTSAAKRDVREIARLVIGAAGLVLLIAFVVGNSNDVRVNYIFGHATTSLIWVILVAALLGVLVDRLIIAIGKRRKKQR
jgi:uncharacterized integral membrane protein